MLDELIVRDILIIIILSQQILKLKKEWMTPTQSVYDSVFILELIVASHEIPVVIPFFDILPGSHVLTFVININCNPCSAHSLVASSRFFAMIFHARGTSFGGNRAMA
eukprot:1055624_1